VAQALCLPRASQQLTVQGIVYVVNERSIGIQDPGNSASYTTIVGSCLLGCNWQYMPAYRRADGQPPSIGDLVSVTGILQATVDQNFNMFSYSAMPPLGRYAIGCDFQIYTYYYGMLRMQPCPDQTPPLSNPANMGMMGSGDGSEKWPGNPAFTFLASFSALSSRTAGQQDWYEQYYPSYYPSSSLSC
jgi:hypothetical protein